MIESLSKHWRLQRAVNYKIQYGTNDIEFSLQRRKRKTLAIHVYPDQHVEVVAPAHVELDKVLQKVKKRAPWIYKKLFLNWLRERSLQIFKERFLECIKVFAVIGIKKESE